MRLVRASDRSVLVVFEDVISAASHTRVTRLTHGLRASGITNLHPAYSSVLISFDPRRITHAAVEQLAIAADAGDTPLPEFRVVEIPVCYGGEFGPDLEAVAAHCGLTSEAVVDLHSAAEYAVYFLGFSPGFPYLGGMPEQLATPRLASPRRNVAAGSIGIAGAQTGIYPLASPGGWRIIGRTPLRLFTPHTEPPTLLRMGDLLRFVRIGSAEFASHDRG